jgi:hypothetical protein
MILIEFYGSDFRKEGLHDIHALVCGIVVGDNDFRIPDFFAGMQKTRKKLSEKIFRVPVQYDDSSTHVVLLMAAATAVFTL